MSKLTDDIATYLRTGDLRGLSIVKTRDALRMRQLDNDRPLSEDEAKTLRTLDALLSSEPPSRIERARGH
jgi:hypothetical protein